MAVGGPLGETVERMIDTLVRTQVPSRVGLADVLQVEQAARFATAEDLRAGGGLTSQLGRATLRWAVSLAKAPMSADVHERLHAALGQLAHRVGWSAFDADQHDTARNLFLVALDAAIVARDRDLRAHVLADIAAQHNQLGYPDDAVELVGVVEGDQRIGPAVRMVLYGVKARAHAAKGEASETRRYLDLAEESYAKAAGMRPTGGRAASPPLPIAPP